MTNNIKQIMAEGAAAAIYPQAASSFPTPFDSLPKERQRKVLDAMRPALTALDAAGLTVVPRKLPRNLSERLQSLIGLDGSHAEIMWYEGVKNFDPSTWEPTE